MSNPFFDQPILNSPYFEPQALELKSRVLLVNALKALYGHCEKTFKLWAEANIGVPPCFIREDDLLRLIVEIKGYRGEDAKTKKEAVEAYWIPGVNRLGSYGRWAFMKIRDVYNIESEFEAKIEAGFGNSIETTGE